MSREAQEYQSAYPHFWRVLAMARARANRAVNPAFWLKVADKWGIDPCVVRRNGKRYFSCRVNVHGVPRAIETWLEVSVGDTSVDTRANRKAVLDHLEGLGRVENHDESGGRFAA